MLVDCCHDVFITITSPYAAVPSASGKDSSVVYRQVHGGLTTLLVCVEFDMPARLFIEPGHVAFDRRDFLRLCIIDASGVEHQLAASFVAQALQVQLITLSLSGAISTDGTMLSQTPQV